MTCAYTVRLAGAALLLLLITGVAPAAADTVATFSDPAANGSTPVFELSGSTFTGGWAGSGLTLITPISGQTFANATFTMQPLTVSSPGQLSGGWLEFHESGGGLILRIDFSAAQVFPPFGWGASELLVGQNVVFSGPIITTPLIERQFAFSFANQVTTANGYTWTAAFTSSAVIPEPASVVALALGLATLWRRR